MNAALKSRWKHPNFLFRAGVEEEKFKSFVGIPILRWGRAIGVIGLYKECVFDFNKDDIIDMGMESLRDELDGTGYEVNKFRYGSIGNVIYVGTPDAVKTANELFKEMCYNINCPTITCNILCL